MEAPSPFYDLSGGGYWLPLATAKQSRWIPLGTSDLRLHLRARGLYDGAVTKGLNPVEQEMLHAQRERWVDYAGPLAGYQSGAFTTGSGQRVLVTTECAPSVFEVPTAKGSTDSLERFWTQLLGAEQLPFFMGWLKYARASLRRGDFRPGQVLVLAGPSGCGKTLTGSLITAFLGGRLARPYRYFSGQTCFNEDLAGAEHWIVDDDTSSTDTRARRQFGQYLKNSLVVPELSIHGKGKRAVTLPTFRRVSLFVNNESENLMILPPLDDSILDKVMLFECQRAEIGEDRKQVWDTLSGELPAFAAWLHNWRLPRSMRDSRYGVRSYQSPALLELVSEIAPETRLLNLVDEVLWKLTKFSRDGKTRVAIYPEQFTGSAEQLEVALRQSPFQFAVEKLLYFSSACGVYLARLAQRNPQRFQCRKLNGRTLWKITKA